MHFTGIIVGFATFMIIGIFHPIVIKAEYYFGRRSWWVFMLAGLAALFASTLVENDTLGIILGVVAFSALWGILEIFQQHERVRKGWFPMNPKRRQDYEK